MRVKKYSLIARCIKDERGQIIPWMVLLGGLVIGVAGITIDLGHAYICYRQLQMSTDAAALSGAFALIQPGATTTTVTNQVNLYASTANGANATPNLPSATIATSFKCITDSVMVAAPCSASGTGFNVVVVTQHATIPTYFIKMLTLYRVSSAKSLTLSSTSTATMASGQNDQVNVAIVLDSTASMQSQDNDANCGNTRIHCALQGVQTMLGYLAPCTASTAKSGATCAPFDRVSLFTYPNITASTTSADTDCSNKTNPSIVPYTTPTKGATWTAPTGSAGTYQIATYGSDWSSNNQVGGSFSGSSGIVNATGGPTGNCGGVQATGGQGTYFAGAIYAAQSSLIAASAAAPGSRNVMIILSDGDANVSSGHMVDSKGKNIGSNGNTYPSLDDQCHQAIDATNYATASQTTVYTIAYGASNSGCSTDKGGLAVSPCSTLQQMSSGYVSAANAPHFYSDATASANKGQCISQYNLDLKGIFGSIAAQLTKARLLPNNIT